ncbi:MAG: NUDIX hydrolase [Balneolaceae bacterium]
MNEHKLLVEKKIKSEEIFKGKLLHVFYDEARLPDGNTSAREWIKHPGACAVVPVFANGDLMMLRQFRYPVAQIFWEVPAGKIDPGERHNTTAMRELQEEAGVKTDDFAYVGHFYPGIGYSNEVIHIYIAWNLEAATQEVDDDEFLTRERIPFQKAVEMVHSGEINDGKTVICLLRAWEWWKKNGAFDVEK